ncbi:hypothetical protein H8356DRAFT_1337543 [Neocallimastix lanati (nom. inval.)]|nr:hypothetical protein H8356DRAFT_1337543 [Neocallimastix sp. JGI-2020a]
MASVATPNEYNEKTNASIVPDKNDLVRLKNEDIKKNNEKQNFIKKSFSISNSKNSSKNKNNNNNSSNNNNSNKNKNSQSLNFNGKKKGLYKNLIY